MDLIKSIIMGVVQGIAEFLPISSDGHLAIMKQVLHIETDTGLLFDILLHFGTLIAIFIVYRKDIWELIVEGVRLIVDCFVNLGNFLRNIVAKKQLPYKKVISTPYRKFVMLVIVSTIPTGFIGVIFEDVVEVTGRTLLVPGLCLILTGFLLKVADGVKEGSKVEETTGYQEAGLIGIAQGLATLPGLSRSGSTITTALLLGLDREFAVKYSFIMSIPAVLGAVVFELRDFSMDMVSQTDLFNYLVGTIVAAAVGYFSIKTMLVLVRGKKFKYFSYYCIAIGMIALLCYFMLFYAIK